MKLFVQVIGWVVVIGISIMLAIAILGMVIPDKSVSNISVQSNTKQVETSSPDTRSEGMVIVDNEYIKATYLGIGNSFGYVTLDVKLENKTEGEITVVPLESSVDDNMVQFLSGVPATMQGHKSITQAWIIGSEPKNNVEFKLDVLDEHWSELLKTDTIRIDK